MEFAGLVCVIISIKFEEPSDQRNHSSPRRISLKENGLGRTTYHYVHLAFQHW